MHQYHELTKSIYRRLLHHLLLLVRHHAQEGFGVQGAIVLLKDVLERASIIESEKMRQADVAVRLGIAQPDVSHMLHGHFRQFSVERLLRFLVALGQHVEIVIRPAARNRKAAAIVVSDAVR